MHNRGMQLKCHLSHLKRRFCTRHQNKAAHVSGKWYTHGPSCGLTRISSACSSPKGFITSSQRVRLKTLKLLRYTLSPLSRRKSPTNFFFTCTPGARERPVYSLSNFRSDSCDCTQKAGQDRIAGMSEQQRHPLQGAASKYCYMALLAAHLPG